MSKMFGTLGDLLHGKLMKAFVCVVQEIGAGAKVEVSSLPMEVDFQLDYVIVPWEVSYDPATNNPRLFYYHDQFVVPDKKLPASLILCQESARVQQLDLFTRRLYRPGEKIVLGVFENTGTVPLTLRAGLVGKALDLRSG